MAGGEIQRRWSEASTERNLLQGYQWGKGRRQTSLATQYHHRTLHGVDYKRKEVRQQPWRNTDSVPFERTDRGLDYRNATDVHRWQMGDLHPRRNGIWQILAARHTRWLDTHLRDRTVRNHIGQEQPYILSKKCFILLIFNIMHSYMSRFFRIFKSSNQKVAWI